MILSDIIGLLILLLIVIVILKIIFSIGGTLLKIGAHLGAGWILLLLVNCLPGVSIPINLVTLIVSGFGGVLGTFLLVLLSVL